VTFAVVLRDFAEGGKIPSQFTCEGDNIAPAISWQGAPEGTESFALIMDDPDAPIGTWNHWLLWDIPAHVLSLPQGGKSLEAKSGANSFGKRGYGGPCPPKGKGPHRYFSRVCALNTATLGLAEGAKRLLLDKALRKHRIAEATYMGRYERT